MQTSLDANPPDAHPPVADPPVVRPGGLDKPPWMQSPVDRPSRCRAPRQKPPTPQAVGYIPRDTSTSVRCASYWNAYLFLHMVSVVALRMIYKQTSLGLIHNFNVRECKFRNYSGLLSSNLTQMASGSKCSGVSYPSLCSKVKIVENQCTCTMHRPRAHSRCQ